MYAVAFDLHVESAKTNHPKGVKQAYRDVENTLTRHGFEWAQGSLYTTKNDDMAHLFAAMMDLRALSWFPLTVRDIRVFKIEQWSDFTPIMRP